jgi:hypothetical protein
MKQTGIILIQEAEYIPHKSRESTEENQKIH